MQQAWQVSACIHTRRVGFTAAKKLALWFNHVSCWPTSQQQATYLLGRVLLPPCFVTRQKLLQHATR